ncbi:carbohydrate ABC transporter membrane protein 1 (CUT1 family) [Hydrogenoanaerobacterium saccharovorans]|uniref:Carbohydrate ABC transporter membrane protein 1, CUT1 family n=1 Tax=Hydrogenoanaerobacterium saccharovorans TaxID=474960 RepID=A0A1H8AXW7_9FIRM|nr:ABC transporter permease subunit [Hydrogenoanaerobacterium saccharovorans]RPF47687.1 carbohydrate ABC transporter membrane protein 1 (CUT1 family) [Hydrogenoanaerobacterium saccharovorans]SEM75555.1 carbohydrate ABC transporter membrane protein 1, CUT1 family [Hydrogenoanaerobacterium saccharovorans]
MNRQKTTATNLQHSIWKQMKNDWLLYAMLLPVLVWYLIFCYLPMGGVTLAFKNYRYDMGLWGSPWVGFEHFKTMFQDAEFWRAFKNTLIFSFGKLLFHFPVPIVVAILLNEIRHPRTKKFFQTVFTFPHFISWVVLSGILINMFASNGIVNQLFGVLGLPEVSPLVSLTSFRPFIWVSNIWKEFGWDSIIYMAALTGIDPQLYEAASIDGANRLQKMRHITWPGIRGTVCIMLILQIGGIMGGASFDQVFNLYSSPVYPVADIIDTYVFRQSFSVGTNFGYTTAIGLLKSLIGVIMITVANKVVTKAGEEGLY